MVKGRMLKAATLDAFTNISSIKMYQLPNVPGINTTASIHVHWRLNLDNKISAAKYPVPFVSCCKVELTFVHTCTI